MRNRLDLLRRNRRLIALFALMVVLPVFVFSVLIVRAVRSERVRRDYDRSERQRRIVILAEADLNHWLFTPSPDAARAQALVRFVVDGAQVIFPDFGLAFPAADSPRQRPFDVVEDPGTPLTADVVTALYYPRIQAFLRDQRAGRYAGAQHFLRLRALVVRPPGSDEGYVIDVGAVTEHVNARLAAFCVGEPFSAHALTAASASRLSQAADSYGLAGFPFFEIVFTPSPHASANNLREYVFLYSMTALVGVALLGSLFVYRAVSHEARLSQLRNEFVAAVSHEFRSPLSSILMLAERLEAERPVDHETTRQYHAIIGQDARRLSVLVSRLLDFAQIEDGKKTYAADRIDLAGVTRDAIRACQPITGTERVRLIGGDHEPLWINGDAAAVQVAIQNLIENAAKYSPAHAAIEVHCEARDGAYLVSVHDRGLGVANDEQEKIFEKFYRGREVAALNVQGVGVGLALVRHIMEAHGGSVSVAPRAGGGSRFILRFPLRES